MYDQGDSIGEIYCILLGRLNPIVRKPVLPFFLKIKLTSVSRGLRGVFLSTIRNLAYTVLRVLSRGQNYRFRTVVTEEPWWNGKKEGREE